MEGITSINIHSGSALLGSPVFFRLAVGRRSNVSFQRAKVMATVRMILSDESDIDESDAGDMQQDFNFSKPIIKDGTIDIDVSSALRAMADNYAYTPHTAAGSLIQYPIFALNVCAWDEYMKNGVYKSTYNQRKVNQTTFYLFQGAWTDMERLQSGLSRDVVTLSRKPADGEVVPATSPLYIHVSPFNYSADDFFLGVIPDNIPKTLALRGANAPSTTSRKVYVSDIDDNYYTFQFVNGFGVLETINAVCLPSETVTKNVKEYAVTVPMQFNKINRSVARKTASRHQFKMSSGPVNEEWQKWWQEEFLNTKSAWMYYNDMWVPVDIIPSSETAGIDLSKDELPEVQFTVKLNIEGI